MRTTIRWTLLLMITLVLTIEAAAQGWASRPRAEGDLQRLLTLTESTVVSNLKVTLKHTSPYQRFASESDFRQTAQHISNTFLLPDPSSPTRKQDLLLYSFTLSDSDALRASLLWVGFPDGSTQISLSAETLQTSGTSRLQAFQQQWTAQLQTLGIQAHWNVMVQGTLVETAEQSPSRQPGLTPSLQLQMINTLEARELARYQDANSLSVSYYSTRISESTPITKGIPAMNLQVAVHRDSITGQQRITLATPAISIAY